MMMINDADGSRMRSKKRIGDRPTDPTRHGTRRSLLQDRLFLTQKCDSGLKTLLRNCIFRCKNEILASTASFKTDILRCKITTLASNAFVKIAFFDAKNKILMSKDFFKIAFFDENMWFWPRMPISKLHFSTQKWDYGLESLFHHCNFRRKHEILVSNAFFKIAFFDANMRFWRRMPSSNLQFSMQIICQICDSVANLRKAFCDKVFQNLSSHALRASHGGGSPWVEQTRHAVFLHIHAV